jgi:hypothetical protein
MKQSSAKCKKKRPMRDSNPQPQPILDFAVDLLLGGLRATIAPTGQLLIYGRLRKYVVYILYKNLKQACSIVSSRR